MISDNQMISGRQASWIFMLDMLAAGLLCGCYAEREPQNRNYIMCMGIDSDPEGGLKISYGFPDLSALTGTDAGEAEPMRVIAAASVSEASELLNASSDKGAR